MMGNKTLAEINAELYARCAEEFKDPVRHLRQQLRRAQRKSPVDKFEVGYLQSTLESFEEEQKKQAGAPLKLPKIKRNPAAIAAMEQLLCGLEKEVRRQRPAAKKPRRKKVLAAS